MARRRRAPAPPPAACLAQGAAPRKPAAPASTTTIDGLHADTTGEVLLRLPSSASLARAVLACRRWGRVASGTGFLRRFRELHPSSPFMGVFVSDEGHESLARPLFVPACSDVTGRDIEAHRDIAAVTRKGDFALTRLDNEHRWRLRDCRNGVLLLSRDHDNSLWVYNPLSRGQPVPIIQPCPDDDVNIDGEILAICLLHGTVHQSGQRLAVDCFRVVSVQQHRHTRKIRAVVYDSGTLEWRCHPWASPWPGIRKLPKQGMMPMYAASRIFWKYDSARLLVLDTGTVGFSSCPLPYQTVYQGYSIGEVEDGKCCLVCLQGLRGWPANPRLQVWELDIDNALEVKLEFKLKEEVPMSQVLDRPYCTKVYDVCTVTNGLAVLTYRRGPHFVVDLQKMSQVAKFPFRAGWGYPYQMPWPPTTNSGSKAPPGIDLDDGSAGPTPRQKDNCIDNLLSTSVGSKSSHDGVDLVHGEGTDGAEHSKLSSSSRMKDPPTLSILDTRCFQSQYMDPRDVNEGSSNEAAPSEKHHTLMSPVNITKTVEVENSKNHLNSAKHDLSEKASLDLDGDSARIQQVKMYRIHELTANSEKSTGNQQMAANSEDHLNECNTYKRKVNPQSEVHNLTDEEPCGQRKKLNTNAASNACSQEIDQHIPSPSSCVNPLVVESEIIPTTVLRQYNLRVHCWKSSVGQLGTTHDVPLNKDASNCPKQGDPPEKSRRKEAAHPKGARSTQSSHAVHDVSSAEAEIISTPTVLQTNLRATCRNSSMGIPATQEKALRKHTCSYTGCGKKYTSMDHLKRHVKDQHTRGTIRLMCRINGCTKGFFVDNNRKSHEKSSAHVKPGTSGTVRIKCQIKSCLSTFGTRRSHNKHYTDFHQKTSASRGGSGRPRKEKT